MSNSVSTLKAVQQSFENYFTHLAASEAAGETTGYLYGYALASIRAALLDLGIEASFYDHDFAVLESIQRCDALYSFLGAAIGSSRSI
jgi:hypothetical protein